MVDFASLDTRLAQEGTFMPALHPVTGKPILTESGEKCGVVLMGSDSAAYIEADNKITRARASDAGDKEAFTLQRFKGENLDRVVACTVAFVHIELDGKPVDNARIAYARLPWLAEQAQRWIEDRANFLPKPPTP